MRSKITIDLDEDNQPIIKIDYIDSEDVRDKMVKRFLETFASDSCWATFKHTGNGLVGLLQSKTAQIRPIPPNMLRKEGEAMALADKEFAELYKSINEAKLEQVKKELAQ